MQTKTTLSATVPAFRRPMFQLVLRRLTERRRFIQVLAGPRQAGKTTLVRQVLAAINRPWHYASADDPGLRTRSWLETAWDMGRRKALEDQSSGSLLVLDEIQKISSWSDLVKRFWDEDTRTGTRLKVVLLGSAPLLIEHGLTDSLAGRFEIVRVPHWSFAEMREAFAWDLDRYIYFGGYPGAAPLIGDASRWAAYILDSLIETTIARDILSLARVDKPALLRQLFRLSCDYSGQVISYQKMLGQLQDAGNTTTLAHYLRLLAAAGLVTGLEKFSGARVRQRGSSPKLLALNTALMTASSGLSIDEARKDQGFWGRLVESAVGAHLVNTATRQTEVFYWRERNREVDFVLRLGRAISAIEVKSGRSRDALPGLDDFGGRFRPRRTLLVGAQGVPVTDFLLQPAEEWIR
jgi:predicted AAA+ superfamily ATPase